MKEYDVSVKKTGMLQGSYGRLDLKNDRLDFTAFITRGFIVLDA